MTRDRNCGWCDDTDEIVPMVQGGSVHMVCAECGSGAGIINFEDLRVAYIKLLRENKELKNKLVENCRPKLVTPTPPRYDDVFYQGLEWLDKL